MSAKAANVRSTRERVRSSGGTAARTGAPATARCADASRWREAGADDVDGSSWAGHWKDDGRVKVLIPFCPCGRRTGESSDVGGAQSQPDLSILVSQSGSPLTASPVETVQCRSTPSPHHHPPPSLQNLTSSGLPTSSYARTMTSPSRTTPLGTTSSLRNTTTTSSESLPFVI